MPVVVVSGVTDHQLNTGLSSTRSVTLYFKPLKKQNKQKTNKKTTTNKQTNKRKQQPTSKQTNKKIQKTKQKRIDFFMSWIYYFI